MSEQSFMDYWNEVDVELQRQYGITTTDAGIDVAEIAEAQEAAWTVAEYVEWLGNKFDLTAVGGAIDLTTRARINAAMKRKG